MTVRSANAEGADSAADRRIPFFPRGKNRIDIDWRIDEWYYAIRSLNMQRREQLPVLQRQDGLQQTGDACCIVEMAEIALNGADGAEHFTVRVSSECTAYPFQLDRVAELRTGAMRLDIPDRLR
ncbi:hypothetical protein D3C84_912060 [compost metagenome]